MKYQISQIAEILQLPRVANEAMVIDTLLTDSRSLTYPETTLFFAMRSRRNDGHRYLQSLYDRGVRNFVVEYIPQSMQSLTDVNFLTVSNVTAALQSIASFHRNSFAIPVVGITGSRGKTGHRGEANDDFRSSQFLVSGIFNMLHVIAVGEDVLHQIIRHTAGDQQLDVFVSHGGFSFAFFFDYIRLKTQKQEKTMCVTDNV